MKILEIIKLIEKTAPLNLALGWDKSGLQVAAYREEISHVAVMLDPLLDNIIKSLEIGADFILAHHPLAIQPRFADCLDNYHTILSVLFKNDLPLYSAHTSLDSNPHGPVRWLAKALGLDNISLLEVGGEAVLPGQEARGAQEYGLGFVGDLHTDMPYQDFCTLLAQAVEKNNWRSSGPLPEKVRRVGCCPGSGADMAEEAKALGADVYITGDARYHMALDFKINVIDIGHFQVEEIMMRKFAELLQTQLGGVQVSFIPGKDPFNFVTI